MGMFDQFKDVMDKAKDKAGEMAKRADSATGGKLSDAVGQARGAMTSAKDKAAGAADSATEQTGESKQWYGPGSTESADPRRDETFRSEP
jgi:uncharacterized protein YjbJ (UPF0337 family)